MDGREFSQVLNLTLKDVEEHLGATEAQLRTMDMEEILKQLYNSTTLDSLPSFMRAPSWQQQDGAAGDKPDAAAAATANKQQQQQQAAVAVTQQQQQPQQQPQLQRQEQQQQQQQQNGAVPLAAQLQQQQQQLDGVVPLSSVRMDQIFNWYAENQAQAQRPQAVEPSMTLSHLFGTAGLHLAPPNTLPPSQLQQGPVVMLPQPPAASAPLHAQLGAAPGGQPAPASAAAAGVPHAPPPMAALHMHLAGGGGGGMGAMLPPGLSPAGPFASDSCTIPPLLAPAAMMQQPALQPPAVQQQQAAAAAAAAQPGAAGNPPKGNAAAARAARARKRKDMASAPSPPAGPAGKAGGGLSAAEAARQAREVAERAAAELAELPQDLADSEAKAIKRAIKNRESAARSRAKRQEYTATLEEQVEQLRQQNLALRHQVVTTAAVPPDPHAAKVDGELLRRSRTGPI